MRAQIVCSFVTLLVHLPVAVAIYMCVCFVFFSLTLIMCMLFARCVVLSSSSGWAQFNGNREACCFFVVFYNSTPALIELETETKPKTTE